MRGTQLLVAAVIAGAGAWSCKNSPTGPAETFGSTLNVNVENDFYLPSTDTVASGSLITWTWATPSNGHTVNWDSGPTTLPANSATLTSGTYVATLTVVGTYHYHCMIHGSVMSGVIIVH
jgi:plastocyanin